MVRTPLAVTSITGPPTPAIEATEDRSTAGPRLSVQQAISDAQAAGFTGADLVTIVAIAFAETGGTLAIYAWHWNTGRSSIDRGIVQINSGTGPASIAYDPAAAFKYAMTLVQGRRARGQTGFEDWTTWQVGAQHQYEPQVLAALGMTGASPMPGPTPSPAPTPGPTPTPASGSGTNWQQILQSILALNPVTGPAIIGQQVGQTLAQDGISSLNPVDWITAAATATGSAVTQDLTQGAGLLGQGIVSDIGSSLKGFFTLPLIERTGTVMLGGLVIVVGLVIIGSGGGISVSSPSGGSRGSRRSSNRRSAQSLVKKAVVA